MKALFASLLDLFFPTPCVVCEEALTRGERFICTRCRHDLPFSRGNHVDVELKFMATCPMGPVYSLFHYHRESRYKNLVHAIKYHDNKRLAIFLGEVLGERIDGKVSAGIIVPLPLHPSRERERGFNQSARLARGISSVLRLPVREDVVLRVRNNPSQTRLAPDERAKNVANVFAVKEPEALAGSEILLVDDVLTTGATIGSCLKELSRVPDVRVSVACLARAGLR
ncbi:MAG: ComF family protein [Odoribacteraceae bacterium]|jgi:ComF family protein|nr:ComF family protein [Odoribacteraceae bacterium]